MLVRQNRFVDEPRGQTTQDYETTQLRGAVTASGASMQEADLPDISTYGKRDSQSMLAPGLHQQYSDSNYAEIARDTAILRTCLTKDMRAEH